MQSSIPFVRKKALIGFTLIEIMVVLVIITIVFFIAIFSYNNKVNTQAYMTASRIRSDLIEVRSKVLTYESDPAGILGGNSDALGYKDYRYQDDLYQSTPTEKTVDLGEYNKSIRINIPGGSCKFKKDGRLDSSSDITITIKVGNVEYYSITIYTNGKIGDIVKIL